MKLVKPRIEIKELSPEERKKNFKEVCLGYNKEEAVMEAARCITCGLCTKGCPVGIDISAFIEFIKNEEFHDSIKKMKEKNLLPAICGRVCPQETQCEKYCPLGKKGDPIAIGKLERFIADWEMENEKSADKKSSAGKNIKVAVIGSGPAGLTCAGELARIGYDVSIFEALHKTGGVLRYGIPEFRLPNHIIDYEIKNIESLGVKIYTNVLVGRTKSIDDLKEEGYKAIFIGTGAGLPRFMGIPGENFNGVYSANDFLTRCNLMEAYKFPQKSDTPVKIGKTVVVVGAGNVAMDSARVALRLGADEVKIVYRRTWQEMPARAEEIEHAKEEGIEFNLLTLPTEILGDENNNIKSMKCIKMELGEPDDSGRRRPVPIEGSEFSFDVNTLVVAIGQKPNPLLLNMLDGLELTDWKTIKVDDDGMTSIPGIFAGGDIVTGAATVILAMEMGKKAADSIDKYIKESLE